jgi:23S rRNA (guanosine2251-2'-O)-methyltransferase
VVGLRPVSEALRAGRRELRSVFWRRTRDAPRPSVVAALELAERKGVPIRSLSPEEFDRSFGGRDGRSASGTPPHQGSALDAGPIPTLTLQQIPNAFADAEVLVALDGVEDPHNLGAIARVAAASGAAGLIVPKRRSAPLGGATSRASAGAIEHLRVAVVPNLREALTRLQKLGFEAIGADPLGENTLYEASPPGDFRGRILVLGGEGTGMRPSVRASLDRRIRIPMADGVESLNVSVAAAIVLFEWRRETAFPLGESKLRRV